MKVVSIHVFGLTPQRPPPVTLASAVDLSSFTFIQRTTGGLGGIFNFFAQTVAERTNRGDRQSVEEHGHTAHCYVKADDDIAAVIITDPKYPMRSAFTILTNILDEFTTQVPAATWKAEVERVKATPKVEGVAAPAPKPVDVGYKSLAQYIVTFQDPAQVDPIMKIQQELDETKVVLHKTIESVLKRGENLNDLIDRSTALSASSQQFYKTAKATNAGCCVIT